MNKKAVSTIVIAFIAFFFLIIVASSTFLTVEAGERGVIFRPFSSGLDKENIYQPGFHVVAPWNSMYIYEVREQQLEEEMTVLSSNGLNINVDVTVRVHPTYDDIGDLHEKFNQDYLERLVRPEVRSAVRSVIGRFEPEELYSSKREEVQTMIEEAITQSLSKNHVTTKVALIRDIELPQRVTDAIEEKIQAEQSALKYEYILQQERKEAERKIIEAQAKAEANRVLNASLSANILRDKGIEATLKLAESENSKVVVVGSGGDGLPLILGNN